MGWHERHSNDWVTSFTFCTAASKMDGGCDFSLNKLLPLLQAKKKSRVFLHSGVNGDFHGYLRRAGNTTMWSHPSSVIYPAPRTFTSCGSRNHGLLLPPISSLCLRMFKAALLSPYYIISHVCQIDEVGFTTGLSFFIQTEALPLIYPTS